MLSINNDNKNSNVCLTKDTYSIEIKYKILLYVWGNKTTEQMETLSMILDERVE